MSLYLLTFVLAFESDRWYLRRPFAIAAGVLAPFAYAMLNAGVGLSLSIQLFVYLAALFVTCMICQGELQISRPEPSHLTAFYLTIAAGGVLGGVFVALLAPRIFTDFDEYPIGLAAACLLGLVGWMRTGAWSMWTKHNIMVRIPLMALLIGGLGGVVAINLSGAQPIVAKWRNFYGILRVTDHPYAAGAMRELTHGRIKHGSQYMDQAKRDQPTSYYGPHSGVAMALNALPEGPRQIAVIGLGTGTMAAWGRTGDLVRFYEINPLVEDIARTWFTFLPDSKAKTGVVLGDARIQMERELVEPIRCGFRSARGRRVLQRRHPDASADRRGCGHLSKTPSSGRPAALPHLQPVAQSGARDARSRPAPELERRADSRRRTARPPARTARAG